MRKNDFCVNDKVVGSCWGTVTTFEELDAKKKDDSLGEVKFIQILNEWNGKWNCGKNAPKQWCKTMVERLSIKLFGAKAIDK